MMDEEMESGGDLESLRQRNEQLEASLRDVRASADRRMVQLELKAEAIRSGIVDLDGLKLIDEDAVSIDEQGRVRGVAAAISRMRRDKPWLFTPASSSSASAVPSQAPQSPKRATEMSLDEWRAARAELIRRR